MTSMDHTRAGDWSKRMSVSSVLLVLVNLLPLFGVVVLDWDILRVMALFWLENVFIGGIGIARLVWSDPNRSLAKALGKSLFFTVHYGAFMFGHGVLLVTLFAPEEALQTSFSGLAYLFQVLRENDLLLMAFALLGSHAWSFASNFLSGAEYERLEPGKAMALPYRRMVITHIALLVGGVLIEKWGEPLIGLIILVGLKVVMDLGLHRSEHKKLAPVSKGV